MSVHTEVPSLSRGLPVAYKRVRLWQWPLRIMHWIVVLSVAALIVTGFYIGTPYFMSEGQAADHFVMARMRFTHFVAAGVLVATAIVRVYWLFAGNKFERWDALLPHTRADWKNLWLILKKYMFIEPAKAPHYLGHNPIQEISYTTMYAVAVVQILTGFYMYSLSNPGGLLFNAFGWVGIVVGGAQVARLLHHVLTWTWLIFIPIHLYLTLRADVVHQESRISSMIGGGRYVRADLDFVDD